MRALRAIDAAFLRAHGVTTRSRAALVCACEPDHVVARLLSETIACVQLEAPMRPMIVVALQEAPEELAVLLLAMTANRRLFPMPRPVRMALSRFSSSRFVLRYPGRAGAEPVPPGDEAPTVARVWWTLLSGATRRRRLGDMATAPRPSPAWSVAFERLVSEARTDPPYLDPHGRWSVQLVGSSTPERVIAILPGDWELVGLFEDADLTMAVFACEAEQGVVFTQDHFQAGLFGEVAVYPDVASYDRARDQACKRCERDVEPG